MQKYLFIILLVSLSFFHKVLLAQNIKPNAPTITEPLTDGIIVNPADVHMETGPFSDPNPGDIHESTDWEIWAISPSERVWYQINTGGIEKVHTHLGDGIFENSHADLSELLTNTDYKLRVRFKDNSSNFLNEWSSWSERTFETGSSYTIFPLELADISNTPVPNWIDDNNNGIILSSGADPPSIKIELPDGELLLEIRGNNGSVNQIINPSALSNHDNIRIVINGGSTGLTVTQTTILFTDDAGLDRILYLPAVSLASSQKNYFWISSNGSSYYGNASQTQPDFTNLARSIPVPWNVLQPGYKVEKVATGFQLPVNIAFVPNPGDQPNDPYFYVTELYGTIKVVRRNSTVNNYAVNLLNFNPTGNFPGSGEQGLAGIVVEPNSGDVIAGMLYDNNPPSNDHYPKVVRFQSNDGGLTAASQTIIKQFPGETQGQSHFISNISIGPDGKLYVHMGDGFTDNTALNLDSYRGKILRMNLDGSAPSDNPMYNSSNGINSRDFIFAYGFRNPFGGAWRSSDGYHYEVENGPGSNDRLAKVTAGANFQWNGNVNTMTQNAKHVWSSTVGPVNIDFIEPETFNGSGFPSSKYDHAFVTESGSTYANGPQSRGKRITEFVFNANGDKVSGPIDFVGYTGSGRATVVGLAAGPDGLYFTDLYKDLNTTGPTAVGANVLRIKYGGIADFIADVTTGTAPLTVQFTDQSNVPDASGWVWNFGDGNSSTLQNPEHIFTEDGIYNVRLSVIGSNGTANEQKNAYIIIGDAPAGLYAEYYDNTNFSGSLLTRIDPNINFNWGNNSPYPSMDANDFSIRWTGGLQASFTATYTLFTNTDDGVRLWIDDQLIIDKWIDQPPTEHSGQIYLVAGERYNITMEYYERGGGAVAQLSWQRPGQSKQIIPQENLYTSSQPLPVELISFEGIVENGSTVFLKWETATEINNYGFNIERRPDNGRWEKIGFVRGSGNSSSNKEYIFIDEDIPFSGKYIYRLKQLDTDGRYEYSNIIEIDIIKNLLYNLSQNFPNPFNPSTSIKYSIPKKELILITIYDVLGNEVFTLVNEEKEAGVHEIIFDANSSGLASGVYFYKLKAGAFPDWIGVKKFILLK